MKTTAKYKENSPKLKDGSYNGNWGGYIARVIDGDNVCVLETDIGIRTLNVWCSVHISLGGEMIVVTC